MNPTHNPSMVIGIGNYGCQITDNLSETSIKNVDFFVCNYQNAPFENSKVTGKIMLDENLKNTSGNTIISDKTIRELFANPPGIVFLLADLKDEWTKKAVALIAQHAKDKNQLTIAILQSQDKAEENYSLWETNPNYFIDAVFPFANNNSQQLTGSIHFEEFAKNIINTFTSMINQPAGFGLIDVHVQDLETILTGSSNTYIGEAVVHDGKNIIQAIDKAFQQEMKDCTKSLLFIWYCNKEITMNDIGEMTDYLQDLLPESSTLCWASGFEDDLNDNLKVTIIASQ